MLLSLYLLFSPLFIMFGFILFFISFFLYNYNCSFFLEWEISNFDYFLTFPIFLDFISLMFIGLVLTISGSILFYSYYYMELDNMKIRFFFLMILFVMSMVFLIICPNFICMLLGWDGLGLVSYCLVIFYQNFKSFSAGMITALTNRVGDVLILGSISFSFCLGTWNYMNVFYLNNYVIFLFMLSAITKSAQIPFSAWLPAAMAAPTPVSSLVHSSTLVTAGVYILIRFSYFMNEIYLLKNFFILISLLTMIMSGLSGLFENDLKKIIALSTLSQLGFMVATLSIGLPNLSFFHLVTHACFKALLFMCAGIFIHSFFDNQDIRCFGLLNKNFSLGLSMFNVANLSLCGFPFLSGFFSKDLILELILMNKMNFVYLFLFLFGTFLTVLYSFRLFYFLTFKFCFFFPVSENSSTLKIYISTFILYTFSIILGFFLSKMIILPYNMIILPSGLKFLIGIICLMSFLISMIMAYSLFMKKNSNLIIFLGSMWFMNFIKTDMLKSFILSNGKNFEYLKISFIDFFFGYNFFNHVTHSFYNFNKILEQMFFISFLFMYFILMFFIFMGNCF